MGKGYTPTSKAAVPNFKRSAYPLASTMKKGAQQKGAPKSKTT